MGNSIEGSSSAAQGAQDPEESSGQRGFFSRFFEALNNSDDQNGRKATAREAVPQSVGKLHRLRVEDIVIPKAEMVAVPEEISKDDLIALCREHEFSRMPVYEETLDKPLGLLLLKDLVLHYGFDGQAPARFNLRPFLRPLLFVPPSMPLSVLLQKMQAERTHMALVIDEYGGVDGLVTIEDVIEQVMGEIEDEHDTEEGYWTLERPGVYLVQARAPLDLLAEEIGVSLTEEGGEEEIDTLGGLVFVLAGQVPARGEVVRHDSGVEFEVVDAEPRRLKRLRLRLPGVAAAE